MVATLTFTLSSSRRLGRHPHLARFPRLPRPAPRLAVAGRIAGPGQNQPQGAVAGDYRLHHHLHRDDPARAVVGEAVRTPSTPGRRSNDSPAERPTISIDVHMDGHHPCGARTFPSPSKPARPLRWWAKVARASRFTANTRSSRLLPPSAHDHRQYRLRGTNLTIASETEMRRIRGNDISMIFREPMTSLNPLAHREAADGEEVVVASRAAQHAGPCRSAAPVGPGRPVGRRAAARLIRISCPGGQRQRA